MALNPISQQHVVGKFDDGVQTTNNTYFGPVKETIDQTPHLPVWNRHEELWYLNFENLLVLERRGQSRFTHSCHRIRSPSIERMWKELQGIDLESICNSIISSDTSSCYREKKKLLCDVEPSSLSMRRIGTITGLSRQSLRISNGACFK